MDKTTPSAKAAPAPKTNKPRAFAAAVGNRAAPAKAAYSGLEAIAAAAPALFAPIAAAALALGGGVDSVEAMALLAAAALAAAPLAVLAAIGQSRALPGAAFALATAPIAFVGAVAAWSGGGVLSPSGPWIFAALAAAGLLGGTRWAGMAALAGLAVGLALIAAPEPPFRLAGFADRDARALAATLSWAGALACLAAVVWAALRAWAAALPPLRHPTIAARNALSALSEAGAVCGLGLDSQGRVRQAVGSVEQTLDLPAGKIIGLSLEDLAHPDDRAELQKLAGSAARGNGDGSGPAPLSVRFRSQYGGFRWLEAAPAGTSFGMPGGVGSADGGALVLRARWRSDRELGRTAATPDAETLAHVNSALRERLKSVVGYTEILKNELFGPIGSPRYRDYARQAHEDGSDLLELVDEMLDLAEIESGRYGAEVELVDPVPLLDGVQRLLETRAARSGVDVQVEMPPNTPHIRIDRRALRRILSNMILDALRQASMGDRVTLSGKSEAGALEFQVRRRRSAAGPQSDGLSEDAAGDAAPGTGRFSPKLIGSPSGVAPAPENEGQLGRMVASALAERMGGSILFQDAALDLPSSAQENESVMAEVLLPLTLPENEGAAHTAAGSDAAPGAEATLRAGWASAWGAEGPEADRRAAREAEEAADVGQPLFELSPPSRPAPAPTETASESTAAKAVEKPEASPRATPRSKAG